MKAGKIKPESKEQWVEMAHSNLETVKATLDSITGREKISEEIATDPANIDNAKDNLTEAQKKLQAEIELESPQIFNLIHLTKNIINNICQVQ